MCGPILDEAKILSKVGADVAREIYALRLPLRLPLVAVLWPRSTGFRE